LVVATYKSLKVAQLPALGLDVLTWIKKDAMNSHKGIPTRERQQLKR
jgi:hypothetical protein